MEGGGEELSLSLFDISAYGGWSSHCRYLTLSRLRGGVGDETENGKGVVTVIRHYLLVGVGTEGGGGNEKGIATRLILIRQYIGGGGGKKKLAVVISTLSRGGGEVTVFKLKFCFSVRERENGKG